jgi:hypothetical protein
LWRELRTRSQVRNLENFGKAESSSFAGWLTESSGVMKARYRGRRSDRRKAQNLTLKEKEKYFVSLYVKEGAIDEKIRYAERRASLKPGTGQGILQRKKVQEEIKARMEPVRFEQIRQQLLGDAAAVGHEALQNDLTEKVQGICQQKIDVEVLDHELMRMVVGLDFNIFPKEKLNAIMAAYVVIGKLEGKGMRCVIPPGNDTGATKNFYTSIFDRQNNSTDAGSNEIYELYPKAPQVENDFDDVTPPRSGASIDGTVVPQRPDPSAITVEVG